MFDFPEPVPDDELEAALTAALQSGGGKITRAMSCEMADVVSEHLVTLLAMEGIQAVRVPQRLPLAN